MSCQFFVYGTLKRGLRNESVWPRAPLSVQVAWTRGLLYGGPHYPAMKPGHDRVRGELWTFDCDQCEAVTKSLDVLEGTNNNSPGDLYHRSIAEVFDLHGQSLGQANLYHYARDPLDHGFKKLQPQDDNYVDWPAAD
ncbi:gamma-glutamylcyclotransferase family protein [Planctomycetes bacterium K23_9]|uniref:AIG2-like family protein n=1 Tax=Stieleria marina TaxID=1930275 RepID=A0A517NYP1_9BACT|nr:AIG2-like family protein [Planctomycetes bacterium K23_9]